MSSISNVYTYFKSIGLEGKEHDKWVTESLSLVPKPNLFQRYFGCCGGNLDKTSITKVMINLDSVIANDAEDPESRSMATFIKGVLENLRLKRDPQLINLKKLNALLASAEGLSNSKALVQEEYLATGIVDDKSNAVRRLRAGDCGPAQQLPEDIIAKIFRHLCLKDRANAAATCWNWKRAETRHDSLDFGALTFDEMLYVSSLRDQTLKGIKENRAFIQAYKTCDFKTSVIANGFMNAYALFQYEPKVGDPILIRNQTSIYIANTEKTIAHNFRADYVLLYEKSINKIFAVDKEADTIHGLYEIDPETGVIVSLFKENIRVVPHHFHMGYLDNKIWFSLHLERAVRIYDRETNTLREDNSIELSPGIIGRSLFEHSTHKYTNGKAARTFKVLLAKKYRSFTASFGEKLPKTSIHNLSGDHQMMQHHSLWFLWVVPFPYGHVSNGMLYTTTSSSKTEVYDILTGKHVRTISFGWFQRNSLMKVFDNKLVYPYGNKILMMELDE